MKPTKIYLYAAREIETGKLVSDITNSKRKYWVELLITKAIQLPNSSFFALSSQCLT